MEATEAQIEERMPAWQALSEFFLDTELQPEDHERIARKLAATIFTENEIEEILTGEICPVCKWNLLSVAGEWAFFDPDWLKAKISPRIGKQPRFRSFFILRHRWMYARHWNEVKKRISKIRAK